MSEDPGWEFFERTFFLLSDGRVVLKRELGEEYRSFMLSTPEKRRVTRALASQAFLAYNGKAFGETMIYDAGQKEFKVRIGERTSSFSIAAVQPGECDLARPDLEPSTIKDRDGKKVTVKVDVGWVDIPRPLVVACQLIEGLKHDKRARPWRPERVRVLLREHFGGSLKRVFGGPAAPWPAALPQPKTGFGGPPHWEYYDIQFLEEIQRLVPSPFGLAHVKLNGTEGYVEYELSMPGE